MCCKVLTLQLCIKITDSNDTHDSRKDTRTRFTKKKKKKMMPIHVCLPFLIVVYEFLIHMLISGDSNLNIICILETPYVYICFYI